MVEHSSRSTLAEPALILQRHPHHRNSKKNVFLVPQEQFVQQILVGNRIPCEYFVTKGKGESDITIHAGSYHLALRDAQIEMCNIITYSSILPCIASEVEKPDILVHGSVMETIMATSTAQQGKRATAGIIYGFLYNKMTGKKYGGLVCEYNGEYSEEEAQKELRASLEELYTNGYSEDFELRDIHVTTESFIPKKKYGTSIVALCFTNYVYPVIEHK